MWTAAMVLLVGVIVGVPHSARAEVPTERSGRAEAELVARVLQQVPLVDGHNDVMRYYFERNEVTPSLALLDFGSSDTRRRQTNLRLLRQGQVGAQLMNAGWQSSDLSLEGSRRGSEFLDALIAQYPAELVRAKTAAEVRHAHAAGKLAFIWSLENPLRLGDSVDQVRALAALGLRGNILAYDVASPLADGAYGPPLHHGLSSLGRKIVVAMQDHGILVDLSHASEKAMLDVLEQARAPVFFSHSSARALCDDARNVPDRVLARLKANRGVVMVSFVPEFTRTEFNAWMKEGDDVWLKARRETREDREKVAAVMKAWESAHPAPLVRLAEVADHIDHVRKVAGVDHVGLGSDFEGIDYTIQGLENAAKFPDLLAELARRGWTEEELRKLAGENFLRILGEAEHFAASRK